MNAQQLQEAKKVANLIVGYLSNNLNDLQRAELDEWLLESSDNIELFEKLTDENKVEESLKWFKNLDEEIALNNVKEKIQSGKKASVKFGYWIAAASLIIGFGYIFYWKEKSFKNSNTDKIKIAETSKVGKSSNAILITESGENIELGSNTENRIKLDRDNTVVDNDGQLTYGKQVSRSFNKVIIPVGRQYQIVLSDGSKVWLNTKSELKFPTLFNENTRTVELVGEAYFEVKSDKDKPFFVKCKKGTIQVTGTSFNVQSYNGDSLGRVTLLEGGIKLLSRMDSAVVKPKQEAIIRESGKIEIQNKHTAIESIAWTEGLFSFTKASINEVMDHFARWYDIKVQYENIPEKQFTGNIPMKSNLESALKMLELSGDVRFILSGNIVTVRP